MSNLRAETEKAAEKYAKDQGRPGGAVVRSRKYLDSQAFLEGATQGPPLLRALEALNFAINDLEVEEPDINWTKAELRKALLEIEAARGNKP